MPVRLYLNNSTTPYTPPTKRGTWDASSATNINRLGPRPAGTAATLTQAEATATNNWDVLLGRWVSDATITAGTLTGTLSFGIGRRETNAAANDVPHLHLYVTAGDTDTIRGTLLANWIDTTEFPTTAAGEVVTGITLTSVALQAGDRLCLEVGYQAQNTVTTSYSGVINYGNTGTTDLTNGSTAVTTQPGWVELSDGDGLFNPLTSTIVDTFNGASLAIPPWGESYGSADIATGRARIPCAHTAGTPDYAGIETPTSYRFDSVYCKLDPAPANGATVTAFSGLAVVDIASTPEGTSLHARHDAVTGKLRLESNVEYFDAAAVEITYNAVDHAWLRIRRSGTDILWETAPDGSTWTTRRTLAAPSWTGYGGLAILAEAARDGGTNNYAYVDAVNIAVTEHAAAATLTAGTALAAAGTAAPVGAATLGTATSVTAAGATTTTTAATLGTGASLAAAATRTQPAAATLDAGTTLTAATTPVRVAAANLAATTALTTAATPARTAAGTLSSGTDLTATATRTTPAAATLTATATLAADGAQIAVAAVDLSTVTGVEASTSGTTGGQATLRAATTLDGTATPARIAGATLAAGTGLAAAPTGTTTGATTLTTGTELATSAVPERVAATTPVTASTSLTAAGTADTPAAATLAATTDLTTDATTTWVATVPLGAGATLDATPISASSTTTTLAATAALDGTGTPVRPAAVTLAADAALTTAGLPVRTVAATLDAATRLATLAADDLAAALAAATGLTVAGQATRAAAAALTARTVVTATAVNPDTVPLNPGRLTVGARTARSAPGPSRGGRGTTTTHVARSTAGARTSRSRAR